MLGRLLEGLARQAGLPGDQKIEILVIDNDACASARAVVAAHAGSIPFPVRYDCVAEPGLSVVRNHALAVARERFALLAMIDDDEVPEPQWLQELLATQISTGATAVVGPVPRELPRHAPQWIARGEFFRLRRVPDKTIVNDGYSGNCLLDLAAPQMADMAFDPAFNTAGGEDQFFFRSLVKRGGRIAYAARAIAREEVGPERLSLRYLLKTEFRKGNTLWFCDARLHATPSARLLRLGKGLARVMLGAAALIPRTAMRGKTGMVESLCDIARGFGTLGGCCGVIYLQYRRC
jgi:glycosyltransferase involved in cell wall biosynthesis